MLMLALLQGANQPITNEAAILAYCRITEEMLFEATLSPLSDTMLEKQWKFRGELAAKHHASTKSASRSGA